MLMRVIELAGRCDGAAAAAALEDLTAAAGAHLDEQSRAELRTTAQKLTGAPVPQAIESNH